MSDRLNPVNIDSQSGLRSNFQPCRVEKQPPEGCESRVSTDSDPDLESEDDDDDYRSTFSDMLMRRLVAISYAQQQRVLREEKHACSSPLQLLTAAADDSYWAKMRRVSQWRLSTANQSETQSGTPSEAASDCSLPTSVSRKRRLSDASLPSETKRTRLAAPSPAPPGSPFFSHPRVYTLEQPECKPSNFSYTEPFLLRAEFSFRSYPRPDTLHVCTACDTSFASRQRLRRHGRGAWTPDACRAAVTYGLE